MRDATGAGGIEDLVLLQVAVLAFSMFFGSLAGAFAAREAAEGGHRLQRVADTLLEAVVEDPRWTLGWHLLDPRSLDRLTAEDVRPLAPSHPFEIVIRNLVTQDRWTIRSGSGAGAWRFATMPVNLAGARVDPAQAAVTVWSP